MCIDCVRNTGFAPRPKERPSRPWVLDETLPKTRNPQEVINEKIQEKILSQAKNKPDSERNIFDYFVLAQDKLRQMQDDIKNNGGVCYLA